MVRTAKILFLCARCRRPVARLGKKTRPDHKLCGKCTGRSKALRSDKGKSKATTRAPNQSLNVGQPTKDFQAPQAQQVQAIQAPVKKLHPAVLAIREGLRECKRKKLI
jgi:hypothetical protein